MILSFIVRGSCLKPQSEETEQRYYSHSAGHRLKGACPILQRTLLDRELTSIQIYIDTLVEKFKKICYRCVNFCRLDPRERKCFLKVAKFNKLTNGQFQDKS